MQSVEGDGDDSPRGSMGSAAEIGAGSDVDDVAKRKLDFNLYLVKPGFSIESILDGAISTTITTP